MIRETVQTRLVLFIFIFIVVNVLSACTSEQLPAPMCRVESTVAQNISANAGCIIRVGNKMITVQHKLSGKLDVPGGTSMKNESAACTAHRETWEETGFNVKVIKWLGSNKKGFHYYACELSGNFNGDIIEFPVPDSAEDEINNIQLLDPFEITELQWRFKNRLPKLREMYSRTHSSKPIANNSSSQEK